MINVPITKESDLIIVPMQQETTIKALACLNKELEKPLELQHPDTIEWFKILMT